MKAFTPLNSPVIPLRLDNIDTDIIIPKQFLKTIQRTGLGQYAFYDMRYKNADTPNPDFPLNMPQYAGAQIVLSGKNFGCGSSREHAPWAILDQGISCILAESFADIFFNNSSKNGLLLITLPPQILEEIYTHTQSGCRLSVDLQNQKLSTNTNTWKFKIEPDRKERLLKGLDDIETTKAYERQISAYEEKRKNEKPWL